ncbi:hypothetical protein C1H46_044894 [Malus baccata]|uniref:Chromatin target of PRMT1 protein C-terminal domain-containing protein n=1 Tax=Malus baccata TaxID=106549 RepID=A0A540K5T7_MALBA|nr:hypothetical protein C1H46_044894 [Malus baccata]
MVLQKPAEYVPLSPVGGILMLWGEVLSEILRSRVSMLPSILPFVKVGGGESEECTFGPGPGNAGGYAMPMVNRGPSRSSRGGNRNGRGKPRGNGSGSGRGRGRGRGGEGRKKPVEKSVDELDKELDSYHADNMQG